MLFLVVPGRVKGLAKRVVVALDVRSNDAGDLVVTKGDQYDVREGGTASGGEVRHTRLSHRQCPCSWNGPARVRAGIRIRSPMRRS